jgi:ABC-type glycerol-3-phosphate transport system permease component
MTEGVLRPTSYATSHSVGAQAAHVGRRSLIYAVVAVGSLISMFPFVWTFLSSGKDPAELYRIPPTLWPNSPQWVENYQMVWQLIPFGQWMLNTAFVTAVDLVGTVLAASLVAYSFARFRYPGRDILFLLCLSTLMLPTEVTLIPQYLLFKNLGWIDTYWPLIVPVWLGGGAFNIFLMRQFIMSIPFDLDEAAKIDGASSLRIFAQILLPLCKPALATMAALGFIGFWNWFLAPLVFLNSPEKYLVAVGLRYFNVGAAQGQQAAKPQDHLLMAASLMVALPCLILFFVAQKYFVQGIVMTGIKG